MVSPSTQHLQTCAGHQLSTFSPTRKREVCILPVPTCARPELAASFMIELVTDPSHLPRAVCRREGGGDSRQQRVAAAGPVGGFVRTRELFSWLLGC